MMCVQQADIICEALRLFGNAIKDCRADNDVLPWAPMLPNVYSRYWGSKCTIFYIGRDTNGWNLGSGGFSDFFCKYDACDFDGYVKQNSSVLTSQKRINAWASKTGSFWYAANLLHIYIQLWKDGNLKDLSTEEKEVLDEMGYANLNSIELPITLKKQKRWKDIDKLKYRAINRASKKHLDEYRLLADRV